MFLHHSQQSQLLIEMEKSTFAPNFSFPPFLTFLCPTAYWPFLTKITFSSAPTAFQPQLTNRSLFTPSLHQHTHISHCWTQPQVSVQFLLVLLWFVLLLCSQHSQNLCSIFVCVVHLLYTHTPSLLFIPYFNQLHHFPFLWWLYI